MTTCVVDAGPLMALAKINNLALLLALFGTVWITDAVAVESVEQGLQLGAPDALIIQTAIETGWLVVNGDVSLDIAAFGLLGAGELSSIALAVARQVDWLIFDDAAAREAAQARITALNLNTKIKGTLGVLVSAYQAGLLSVDQAIEHIGMLRVRPDVWISHSLCDRVIQLLKTRASP